MQARLAARIGALARRGPRPRLRTCAMVSQWRRHSGPTLEPRVEALLGEALGIVQLLQQQRRFGALLQQRRIVRD